MNRVSRLRASVHAKALYRPEPPGVTHSVAEFRKSFGPMMTPGGRLSDTPVVLHGRVAAKREAGKKLVFYTLEQDNEPVQVMCIADGVDFAETHALVSRGDIVRVHGIPGATQKGELSVVASSLLVESPCLVNLPLPGTVTAQREHRRRYRDMLVNPESIERMRKRSHILAWLRNHLNDKGFLEVETPILSLKSGGAMATPFMTQCDPPLYLRIAPELYLKQLIVGGLSGGVYEMGKQFRNEGVDHTHVNEFTTLELYRAGWDYEILMTFTEELLGAMVAKFGAPLLQTNANWQKPFPRVAVVPAINAATGASLPEAVDESHLAELRELCEKWGGASEAEVTTWGVGRCVDRLLGRLVEPTLQEPTFLIDHPRAMSPLAQGHRSKGPGTAERFEFFAGGLEYVNAYSELTDPEQQQSAFERQLIEADPESPRTVDTAYVEALRHGMPSAGGWGLGVDRLVMLLSDTDVIDNVIFFPRETTGPLVTKD